MRTKKEGRITLLHIQSNYNNFMFHKARLDGNMTANNQFIFKRSRAHCKIAYSEEVLSAVKIFSLGLLTNVKVLQYLAGLWTGRVIRIILQSILRIQVRRISDCWMREVARWGRRENSLWWKWQW